MHRNDGKDCAPVEAAGSLSRGKHPECDGIYRTRVSFFTIQQKDEVFSISPPFSHKRECSRAKTVGVNLILPHFSRDLKEGI